MMGIVKEVGEETVKMDEPPDGRQDAQLDVEIVSVRDNAQTCRAAARAETAETTAAAVATTKRARCDYR